MTMNLPSAAVSLSKQSTETTDCQSKLEGYSSLLFKISPGESLPRPSAKKNNLASIGFQAPSEVNSAAQVKAQDHATVQEKPTVHCCKIVRMHRAGKTIVFVKNLKKTTRREIISREFSKHGRIAHIQLPFNAKKRRNLGYCYLVYQDDGVAKYLIETLREVVLEDKMVALDPFYERPVIHRTGNKNQESALLVQSSNLAGRSLTNEGGAIESEQMSKKGIKCTASSASEMQGCIFSSSNSPLHDVILQNDKPTQSTYFKSREHLYDCHREGNIFYRVNLGQLYDYHPL